MKPFSKFTLNIQAFQCIQAAIPILGIAGMLLTGSARGDGNTAAKNDGDSRAGAVTEDALGGLHGDYTAVRKPLKEFAIPVKGDIRGVSVTPDAKRLVFHELVRNEDGTSVSRVSAMELATGKVTRLQEWPQMAMQRMLAIAPDGKSVVLEELEDGSAGRYELETGKRIQRYDSPQDKPVGSLHVSPDGKRMAGGSRDFGAVYWDLEHGEVHHAALDFVSTKVGFLVYPLSGRKTLLVIALPEREGAPTKLVLKEPDTGRTTPLTEIAENFDVRFDAVGKTLYVFRQRDPDKVVWTGIELWDVDTAKIRRTIELKPPMSSIGLTLTQDGRYLFLHQYMAQQAVVWDLIHGKTIAVAGPVNGGFRAFTITPDGGNLIGITGTWVEGVLRSDKVGLFDTRSLVR
ncbi:MAG: WD40 repeat domain-containing protein [Verrucomicrobia bacterium]|nr:WD40 repeat domain-containing protein [Verrucomicrobiota bacterium]